MISLIANDIAITWVDLILILAGLYLMAVFVKNIARL